MPADVHTPSEPVKTGSVSTETPGWRCASRSPNSQWVVARRPSRRPASARMKAPVHSAPTRRDRAAGRRTTPTKASSSAASWAQGPPTTTRVSIGPAQAGQVGCPGELEAAPQGQRPAAHRGHRDPVGGRAAGLGGHGVGQGEDVAGAGQLHTEDTRVADDDDLADHGNETRARRPLSTMTGIPQIRTSKRVPARRPGASAGSGPPL